MFYILIILAVILEVIGDTFCKFGMVFYDKVCLMAGILFYIAGSVAWIVSLKYEIFTKAGTVFIVLNMIMFVAVGVFLFKDKLSLLQWVGIVLGILSLILINK